MPVPDLASVEAKALRVLWSRGPLSRGALKVDSGTQRRLIDAGWVTEIPPAKKRQAAKLALTEEGQRVAARVPPAKPTMADLYREIAATRAELEELRALLTRNTGAAFASSAPRTAGAPAIDQHVFRAALRAAIAEIDRRDHHGGLVPIGEIRHALAHLGLARDAFDAALREEERVYTVDLKVANNPARAKAPETGIPVEGRGLLYYAILR